MREIKSNNSLIQTLMILSTLLAIAAVVYIMFSE